MTTLAVLPQGGDDDAVNWRAWVAVGVGASAAAFGFAGNASASGISFVSTAPATGVRLCHFGPTSKGSQPTSCRDTHVPAAIDAIENELNALHDVSSRLTSCPRDDGREVRLVIAYADGHRERVDVGLAGCRDATHPPHAAKATTPTVQRDLARRSGYSGSV